MLLWTVKREEIGSGKFKMAASKLQLHISQLVHKIATQCLCFTHGNDSGVRGASAVVGLACIGETGYWALKAKLIIYLC